MDNNGGEEVTTKNGKNSAETVPKPKWKIPPQRIESDDCTVYVGREIEDGEITDEGTPYKVHEGEYVELFPVRSLKELMALTDIGNNTAGSLRTLCIELSQRIMEWDWTGMDGKPLPQPYNAPDVLERLTDDELMWLMQAVKGKETTATRKNA